MAKKSTNKPATAPPQSPREHIISLVNWMSQGVYEKEQIIAVALLCAVAGENIFLLGPPGTAKSMVASRLKMVFKDAKSFDYLMSRFSTPDEIFGPISISRLKNDDRYERLTAGYLPEADIVFLDEIWKAGPSIQNTLLTVINEHIFHNGGNAVATPMKVLIAASNELPAKDEGLEALWDRFLVRMVSNCIESDTSFFKMLKSGSAPLSPLSDHLYITEQLYRSWQSEALSVTMPDSVVAAIKALRRSFADLEKKDDNKLRYYISDRRWRKAYHLMQTSAYLNGRSEMNLSDYMLLVHSFWNDVETIPAVLEAFTASIAEPTLRQLARIDKELHKVVSPRSRQSEPRADKRPVAGALGFVEYEYFYYKVENYPDGETYFSKWDYASLPQSPREGVRFYDFKRNKIIIHTLVPGVPFEAKSLNASNIVKVSIKKCQNGAIINGTPYSFERSGAPVVDESLFDNIDTMPVYERFETVRKQFADTVANWDSILSENWYSNNNIFLSSADLSLANKMIKDVADQIKAIEVKLNNVSMIIK